VPFALRIGDLGLSTIEVGSGLDYLLKEVPILQIISSHRGFERTVLIVRNRIKGEESMTWSNDHEGVDVDPL